MNDAVGQLDDALEALDRALAARPHLEGKAFTEATEALCRYRDDQRRALDGDAPQRARGRLKAANVGVTLLMAGHFPLGEIPWDRLEQARGHLAEMRAAEAREAAPA